jgi:hypothetical protein
VGLDFGVHLFAACQRKPTVGFDSREIRRRESVESFAVHTGSVRHETLCSLPSEHLTP